MRRAFSATALILAALLALPSPAKAKDQLVIGLSQFPLTLNPDIDEMLAKNYILGATHRPVTMYDTDWRLICMLCTQVPTLENGGAHLEDTPDGKHGIAVTYHIQPKATWGDGVPVTAQDAVFTWRAGRDEKSGFTGEEFYRRVWKLDAEDEKTFTVHYDKVFFDYNALTGFQLLPAHIEQKVFEQGAEDYKNRTTYVTDPTNKGLYFGPYRITQVVSGSHVVLEPNPTWWGPKPFFQRVTVRANENTAAMEANLLSGAIDMIDGDLGIALDEALAFEKRHKDQFAITYTPGLIYEHIDLNLANPILADKRVREALIAGIDREQISKRLFDGRQPVANGFVSELDWVYDPDVPKHPYDPAKAKALLDEAGWAKVVNGVRTNAKGEKLSLELMTTAGNRSRELVEQVLQSQWKAIGIEVRIRNQPPRVFFGESMTKRQYQAMGLFAWVAAPESVPRAQLHSEHIPTEANNWAGQNYTGFKNAEADKLIDAMEVELDKPKRKDEWWALQKLYAEELPVIPLYFRANAYILPKWLSGVTPTGHLGTTTLWIENWKDTR